MAEKHVKFLLGLLYAALAFGAAWLLLPWLLPFLLGLALAAILERPLVWLMDRLHMPRAGAAGLCTVLMVALLCALAGLVLWRGCYELGVLFQKLPALLGALPEWQRMMENWVYRMVVAAPISVQDFLRQAASSLLTQGINVPSALYVGLLDFIGKATAAAPNVMLFSFTAILATYFIAAYRPALFPFFRRQLPREWLPTLRSARKRLRHAFGGWLKAQGILLLVTFAILTVGLLLLGTDLALLIAAGTALLDALPVFGVGIVLIPWAIIALFTGKLHFAIGLIIIQIILSLTRSLLEPKLVGDRVGLHPLAALFAMYGGFHFFGVAGMILSPLFAIMIKQLHDCGIWRLWKE